MKKFASLVLAGALVATALVACTSSDDKESSKEQTQESTVEDTEKEDGSKEESKEEDTKGETEEENNEGDNTDGEGEGNTDTSDLTAVINGIYEKYPVEMMLGEPMQVDITDADLCTYYLGLQDGSDLAEAYFSEPMMSSQAYSLVVAKAAEDADLAALTEEMFNGIDQAKWLCVDAQQLTVASCGDLLILVMAGTELGEGMDEALANAFAEVCGGTLENVLSRDETIRP